MASATDSGLRRLYRSWSTPRAGIAGAAAFSIAIVWGAIFYHLDELERAAIEGAEVSLGSTARVMEENAIRSIDVIDQAAQFVRHEYLQDPQTLDLNDIRDHVLQG